MTAVSEARAARQTDPSAPFVTLGRFELEALLGCGGMGIVFRARDPKLDRPVALKLWNLEGERAELALRHEALCQAQISHPNVVTIYEIGKVGDDMYLAMEYVDGMDVRRWLERRSLLWQQTLALFIHAGRGLAAVHARGLVHGDFKPENVLLGRDGRVLVADFGLARAVGEFEGGGDEDRERGGGGTRVYMAPERLEGRLGNACSDQFSLCVALWECLHGVRPFAGESASQLLMAMAAGKLQTGPVIGVPEPLRVVLRKGLALDPAARYESVDELLTELHAVPTKVRRRRRRRVLGVVGLAGVLSWALGHEREAESPAPAESSHIQSGISPAPETTVTLTSELELPDVLDMIDRGQLDEASAWWRAKQAAGYLADESFADVSLPVAAAFLRTAKRLEHRDPETALWSALLASEVAASVPVEPGVKDQEAAAAETISTTAASLILKLVPIVQQRRDQSKHSTVPSSLE